MSIRKVKSLGAIVLVLTLSALALLFTLGLCRAQVISATDDQNLIENPGFENEDPGDPGNPINWKNGETTSDGVEKWKSDYAHTGDHSVEIHNYFNHKLGWWQSTPPVTVTAMRAYTFSGWISTKGGGGRAFLSLFYRNSDGELIEVESNSITGDSNGWVQVRPITPVLIPSGTTTAFLRCQLDDGSGIAWFDDVVLRPVTDFVDLEIEKQAEPSAIKSGGRLTYFIAYRNTGNLAAEDVFITDTLPPSVTLIDASPPYTQPLPRVVRWHIDGGLAGSSALDYVTVVVTVNNGIAEGQWLTNTAVIVAAGDASPATDQITTKVTSGPVLSLEKRSSAEWVLISETLRYTLTYRNVGYDTAGGVRLTDDLPSGVNFVASTLPVLYLTDSHSLAWEIPPLEPGDGGDVFITVTVKPTASGGTLLNKAEIRSDEASDRDSAAVQVYPTYLGLNKRASSDVVIAGQLLTYTLEYSDNKSGVASGVVLTDYLPSDVLFFSANPSATVQPGSRLRWELGGLEGDGAPHTVTVVVTVSDSLTEGHWLTNTATIVAEDAFPDTDQISTTVTRFPVLSLDKKSSATQVLIRETLRYTLTYGNVGSAAAISVCITDDLPSGVAFVSDTLSTLRLPGDAPLVWNIPSLEAGEKGNIVITVTVRPMVSGSVTEDQELTNVATITAKNAIPATDQISVQIRPFMVYLPIMMRNYAPPSLHLSTITVDKDVAYWGDTLYYTITLTNSGTTEAITPTMISKIPVQSTIITGSISNSGKVEDGAVRWDGRVDPGKSQVITFTVQLTDSDCAFVAANQVTITAGSAIWTLDLRETQVRCVKDGGFEGGDDNWGEWYHGYQGEELSRSIQSEYQYSGEYAALLGDPEYLCSNVPIGSAWVTQTVLVPNTNDPKLSFWYRIFTQDRNAAFDRFEVYVKGIRVFLKAKDSGRYGCNLEEEEMDLGWQPKTINLRDYFNPDEIKGQFVIIRFENWNYPDNWFNTYTYLDDVQMIR